MCGGGAEGGNVIDALEFLLVNFAEMNKLWVRMQHQVSELGEREERWGVAIWLSGRCMGKQAASDVATQPLVLLLLLTGQASLLLLLRCRGLSGIARGGSGSGSSWQTWVGVQGCGGVLSAAASAWTLHISPPTALKTIHCAALVVHIVLPQLART